MIYSDLNFFLKKIILEKNLGIPIYSNINITNGISFKKEMSKNWRFTSKSIFQKLTGNVGIHYLGLMRDNFGAIKNIKMKQFGALKNHKIDNSLIDVEFRNNFGCKIFLSYSTIANDEINIYFTNGQIHFDGKRLILYYPRDVFNKKGNFIKPKKKIIKIFSKSWSENSLKKTMDIFLKKSLNKKNFNLIELNNFLDTNKLFLNLT